MITRCSIDEFCSDNHYRCALTVLQKGWMFVPLEEYEGGGAAAIFEPLEEHLSDYEWALAQYLVRLQFNFFHLTSFIEGTPSFCQIGNYLSKIFEGGFFLKL